MTVNRSMPLKLPLLVAAMCASLAGALLVFPTSAVAAGPSWYVQGGSAAGGSGAVDSPFGSLAEAEAASAPGDTIVVLPSPKVLDGGIELKPGQRLVGEGPSVTAGAVVAPQLTNTTDRLDGDAVRLADGTTVQNLRITGARRGAVYGLDVTEVLVEGNDVAGQNTSCTPGFLIPAFIGPTNVPGIGIPVGGGLQNGWAGIMIDVTERQGVTATIADNLVRDADCGDGIDIRTAGSASADVTVRGNDVRSLKQGPDFKSVLAIGMQASDTSELTAIVHDNTQSDLGDPEELNFILAGSNSEGVYVNGVGPSRMHVTITENIYTNDKGVGNFSANGLEVVTMGSGSDVSVVVRDSHFSGSPGDLVEHGALGTDARMEMLLERVTVERSAGFGDTKILPFNNGDCVVAGSLGARNDVSLVVRDSVLRDCSNNGLSIGSNVVNGTGASGRIVVEVDNTQITGNRGGNLSVRNFTKLDELVVKVQRSNLAGSSSFGSSIADVSIEDFGRTTRSTIDLGGGALGSVGQNCVVGGLLAANVVRYKVAAKNTWWGRPGGPGLLRTLALGGLLNTGSALASAPAHCR
ncbi:hypothetical protein [Aeromicrobium marinum]|nr:hypothetical protein [Aeromicrobium marinum]